MIVTVNFSLVFKYLFFQIPLYSLCFVSDSSKETSLYFASTSIGKCFYLIVPMKSIIFCWASINALRASKSSTSTGWGKGYIFLIQQLCKIIYSILPLALCHKYITLCLYVILCYSSIFTFLPFDKFLYFQCFKP